MSPKESLRGEIRKILKTIPAGAFRSQGEAAAALLRCSPLWARYKAVFLFLSMNSEINTIPLLEGALADGKKIFAPRVEKECLSFCRIQSPDGPWIEGPFGIREPAGELEAAKAEDFPALVVAPGLAFDEEGNRLGKGKGYYDRFFGELDSAGRQYTALGLCMDFQIVEKVPVEKTDKKMDWLLTGSKLKEL